MKIKSIPALLVAVTFFHINATGQSLKGSWAQSIRYHDNKFWIYFCSPDEGLFMSSAEKAEGGVAVGWQMILRSKNIYGPYEKKVVLEKGTTQINGIHQGSHVDIPGGQLYLFTEVSGKITSEIPVKLKKIFLKVSLDIKGDKNQFLYSSDNKSYTPAGELFTTAAGYWKGTRLGLFSFNEINGDGAASFNSFTYNYDGPKGQ